MRYRLGDIQIVPQVITLKPKAVEPEKVVERPVATAATPLLVKREFDPKSVEVVVPPDAPQEVSDHPNRDERKGAKDKL